MSESGTAAVGVLVAAFKEEGAADQVLEAAKNAKKQGRFYYDDAAVIRQDEGGKVHYHETGDMSSGKGALVGGVIGGVIGIIGGPTAIAAGAGIGAAIGAAAASHDAGFDNQSLKEIGMALKPGTSAVLVTTSELFVEAARRKADQLDEVDRKAALQNLANDISARLEEGRDVIYDLVITEKGVAMTEIAADDESVVVLGIAATEEGIAAGAAVTTEEGVAYKVGTATEDAAAVEAGVVTEDAAGVVDAVATDEGTVVAGAAAVKDDEDPEKGE